jgi:enoyl-CoA hydratase/carnithine racemase
MAALEKAETMSLEQSLVLSRIDVGVATLTLNRPSQYNALSTAMLSALREALEHAAADASVRVVVIAAAGKAFCAGHDLREMRANDDVVWQRALFDQCASFMMRLQEISQPVIAQVQGVATAAGCQLVAACDMAVASRDAQFATSGIGLGLFCSTPSVAVLAAVPAKQAAEMLFGGGFIDADRAERIGLVGRVVDADALSAETERLAQQIAAHSGAALQSGKQLLRAMRGTAAAKDYELAAANMARDMQSDDAKCGIDAFLQKQATPVWKHR